MELSQIMDSYLGTEGGAPLHESGFASRMLHEMHGSEQITCPFIATTFWQAFIESPGFAKTLWKAGASHSSVFEGDRFVVTHGSGWTRQDLVIFDPTQSCGEPKVLEVQPTQDDLIAGWERFRQRTRLTDPHFRTYERAAIEASLTQPFGVVIVSQPTIVFTRCPSPPWSVMAAGASSSPGAVSTAGAVVKNDRNKIGVTAALHALGGAKQALIENKVCNVVSEDVISDSCFIEVPGCCIPPQRGLSGPLRGITPRVLDPCTFEGVTSGMANTIVTSWSPDLPFVLPYSQMKVLTKANTNMGDSGAALIDSSDHILGFAFCRTGFGAPIEYAAWIWADSVFQAHHLSII